MRRTRGGFSGHALKVTWALLSADKPAFASMLALWGGRTPPVLSVRQSRARRSPSIGAHSHSGLVCGIRGAVQPQSRVRQSVLST